MKGPNYQANYLSLAPQVANAEQKGLKVAKMLAVLKDAAIINESAEHSLAIDIGCSVGYFAHALAPYFSVVAGVDIDLEALKRATYSGDTRALFLIGDSQRLPFGDGTADLVICNHVYEHVPDAQTLFREINRVLRPGGACYLGAASRLTLVEPHYRLPFLSWLPKALAHRYMRATGRGSCYYEKLRTPWSLLRMLSEFERRDYTLSIIGHPDKYCARDMIPRGSVQDRIPLAVWKLAYWLLPSYVFVLYKRGR